jgi:hypothetical protein
MEDIMASMSVLYPNIEVKFSTVKQYQAAIQTSDHLIPEFNDDFVPYQFEDGSFWSGYFTSNPSFKRRVGIFSNSVRAILTLSAL